MSNPGYSKGSEALKVRVDGEDAILHITDRSVMFEKGGRVSGFEKSTIRMVKADGDAMIIAYSAGSEVKSVQVEPMTAVASLLMSSSPSGARPNGGQVPTSTNALDEVFERLYRDTRKELEEKLARIQENPLNLSLRLTPDEESRYGKVSVQMKNLAGSKHGFDPRADDNPISFWGLEKQPYELQLDVVKIRHIGFLRDITSPRAEIADAGLSSSEVWPENWEHILTRFNLSSGPILTCKFRSYLESKWKNKPGARKPTLANS